MCNHRGFIVAKTGPKGKLTDRVRDEIAAALSRGLTRETAARYAHISYQSFWSWMQRGKAEFDRQENDIDTKMWPTPSDEPVTREYVREERKFLRFFNQITDAEVTAIYTWQETVNTFAKADGNFALKMLQLRDPKGYRDRNISYTYDLSQATDEQLESIAAGADPAEVMAGSGIAGATTPQKPASAP